MIKDLKIYYMEDDAGAIASNRIHPEIVTGMRRVIAHLETKHSIKAQKVNTCFTSNTFGYLKKMMSFFW